MMPLLVDYLQKQYLTEKSKLAESAYKLYLMNAVVCLCRSKKSRVTDDLQTVVYMERETGKLPPIPDYALDKHTARGKALGKGIEDFFTEGNKVANEAFPNPYTEKAKELLKKLDK
jgi:replication-associated recombination protein RarA